MAERKDKLPEGYRYVPELGAVKIVSMGIPIYEHISVKTGMPCPGTVGVEVLFLGVKESSLVCGTCYNRGVIEISFGE